MRRDELRQCLIVLLDDFEASTRLYLAKVEEDRPAVAEAQWDAVWQFRLDVMQAHDNLTMRLRAATAKKDED